MTTRRFSRPVPTRSPHRRATLCGLLGGFFAGLLILAPMPLAANDLPPAEVAARAELDATPIELAGTVYDHRGLPFYGATVRSGGLLTATDPDGIFLLTGLPRQNAAVEVEAPGFRPVTVFAHLLRAVTTSRVELRPVVLVPDDPGTVRFLFGGDVAFGRRFLETTEPLTPRDQMPADDPDAFIQVSDPEPGTRDTARFIKPYFSSADWSVLNFETPVTDDPSTAHPTKAFAFFTLPGSLPALPWLGVDYVSLGNNHVYDYLEDGLVDTLFHLQAAGIPSSGAGLTADEAFAPYRTTLGGHPYSFISANSVSGSQHAIDYVAGDGKGGAADLRDTDRLVTTIETELAAGRRPIVQLHTGKEYTFEPSGFARDRMELSATSGAALVIGHHPHVAQGFQHLGGTLIVHGLGNFIFDQARLETMLGVLTEVDLAGGDLLGARAVPVYLEDFRPRPIGGHLADVFLRRLAEFSDPGTTVVAMNGRGTIAGDPADVLTETLPVTVEVEVPAGEDFAVVDLRGLAPSWAYLSQARTLQAGVLGRLGRDLMDGHGDFEDYDVDDDAYEASRWDHDAASRFPCLDGPFRGAVAMCSTRDGANVDDSIIAFRNRTRVAGDAIDEPAKDLSLFGYLRGENAGPVRIVARYFASFGDAEFGEEDAFVDVGGTFAWRPFAADLHMPADTPGAVDHASESARAVRIFLRHGPTASGEGLVRYDEIAIVSWEVTGNLSAGLTPPSPHAHQFLRVDAPPGTYSLELEFTVPIPFAASGSAIHFGDFESGDFSDWDSVVAAP